MKPKLAPDQTICKICREPKPKGKRCQCQAKAELKAWQDKYDKAMGKTCQMK